MSSSQPARGAGCRRRSRGVGSGDGVDDDHHAGTDRHRRTEGVEETAQDTGRGDESPDDGEDSAEAGAEPVEGLLGRTDPGGGRLDAGGRGGRGLPGPGDGTGRGVRVRLDLLYGGGALGRGRGDAVEVGGGARDALGEGPYTGLGLVDPGPEGTQGGDGTGEGIAERGGRAAHPRAFARNISASAVLCGVLVWAA